MERRGCGMECERGREGDREGEGEEKAPEKELEEIARFLKIELKCVRKALKQQAQRT